LFQFVDEFLDAFEIYDYNQICEEFQTLLINGDSSSKGFSTRIYHVLCKFNLYDMSFVLNILYDACIQSYSIANDEGVTNTIAQLQEELCSRDERDLLGPYNVPFCPHFLLPLHLVSLTFKLTSSPYPIFPKEYNSLLFTICLICFAYNFTLLSYLAIDQKCIIAEIVQTAD
jgi:hypothetical protein